MTFAGSIKTILYDNWLLTGDLARTKVHFADSGWLDHTYLSNPQVVVTQGDEPIRRLFGGSLYSYPRFYVNLWLQIPQGANGTAETQQIDDMRYEVVRIIKDQTQGITGLALTPLNEGIPHHEWDSTPRFLRFEVTLIGAQQK